MQAQGRSAAFTEAVQKELDATRLRAAEVEAKMSDTEARLASEFKSKGLAEEALATVKVGGSLGSMRLLIMGRVASPPPPLSSLPSRLSWRRRRRPLPRPRAPWLACRRGWRRRSRLSRP